MKVTSFKKNKVYFQFNGTEFRELVFLGLSLNSSYIFIDKFEEVIKIPSNELDLESFVTRRSFDWDKKKKEKSVEILEKKIEKMQVKMQERLETMKLKMEIRQKEVEGLKDLTAVNK